MGMHWNCTVSVVCMKSMSSCNIFLEWNNNFVIIMTSEWAHPVNNANGLNKVKRCGGYNLWFLASFISIVFLTIICNRSILGKKRHIWELNKEYMKLNSTPQNLYMLQDAHLYSGYKQQHYGHDLNNIKAWRCLRIAMAEATSKGLMVMQWWFLHFCEMYSIFRLL